MSARKGPSIRKGASVIKGSIPGMPPGRCIILGPGSSYVINMFDKRSGENRWHLANDVFTPCLSHATIYRDYDGAQIALASAKAEMRAAKSKVIGTALFDVMTLEGFIE